MNSINAFLSAIALPQDKANHALWGALAFALSAALVAHLVPQLGPRTGGLLGAIALGAAKEGLDAALNALARGKGLPAVHDVSLLDALATSGGGVLAWVAVTAATAAR